MVPFVYYLARTRDTLKGIELNLIAFEVASGCYALTTLVVLIGSGWTMWQRMRRVRWNFLTNRKQRVY